MNITLRQLEVFCAIAHRGNVSRAAEDASISQSAASMALAELERQLGELLFDRFGKKLALNENGKLLRPRALELLARTHEIEGMFTDADGTGGELKTGASSTIGNYLMPGILSRFSHEHPRARIALRVGNTEQIIAAVLACEIDVGFIEGPCSDPNIETRIWREDELIVFAHPGHSLAAKKKVLPKDLVSAEWVLRERGSGTRSIFERAVESLPGSLSIRHELGHSEAIKRAVKNGLGISCLSRLTVQEDLENGTLVELKTPFLQLRRNLYILLRKDKYMTGTLRLFLDALTNPES